MPVRIAPGCVIGAGAVVTKDLDRPGVYVGNPARLVRELPQPPAKGVAASS